MTAANLGRVLGGVALVLWSDLGLTAAPIEFRTPWIRMPPPGVSVSAGYVTIVNPSDRNEVWVAASSPAVSAVEIHATVSRDGVMRMRPVDRVPIPAGGTVRLTPGGMHLMLMGFAAPLVAGQTVPVTLVFERVGPVTVMFLVRD